MARTCDRVLLVDDNSDDVLLIHAAFRKVARDAHLMVLPDGYQAIDLLKGVGKFADREKFALPAVMLLDLRMPKMNGFQVLKWVRGQQCFRGLPITVFSGSSNPEDVRQAYDLGANSFLSKPFGFEALCVTIRGLACFWLGCCLLPSAQPFVNLPGPAEQPREP